MGIHDAGNVSRRSNELAQAVAGFFEVAPPPGTYYLCTNDRSAVVLSASQPLVRRTGQTVPAEVDGTQGVPVDHPGIHSPNIAPKTFTFFLHRTALRGHRLEAPRPYEEQVNAESGALAHCFDSLVGCGPGETEMTGQRQKTQRARDFQPVDTYVSGTTRRSCRRSTHWAVSTAVDTSIRSATQTRLRSYRTAFAATSFIGASSAPPRGRERFTSTDKNCEGRQTTGPRHRRRPGTPGLWSPSGNRCRTWESDTTSIWSNCEGYQLEHMHGWLLY